MSDETGVHPSVERALSAASAPWRAVRHDEMDRPIRSPDDFAAALGWDVGRITKSLLLRAQRGDAHAIVVCRATAKLDFAKVGAVLGTRYEVAPREDLETVVGYPVTGVTPLGVSPDVRVVVDAAIADVRSVMTGGGALGVEVEVDVGDLVGLTAAVVADVTRSAG